MLPATVQTLYLSVVTDMLSMSLMCQSSQSILHTFAIAILFADMMMMMYFHGGYNETILFDFWRISTLGGLIGSMIGCFLLGILYEGLKFFREFLFSHEMR